MLKILQCAFLLLKTSTENKQKWKITPVFFFTKFLLTHLFFLQVLERVAQSIQTIKKNGSILMYSNLCSNGKSRQDVVIIMDSWWNWLTRSRLCHCWVLPLIHMQTFTYDLNCTYVSQLWCGEWNNSIFSSPYDFIL